MALEPQRRRLTRAEQVEETRQRLIDAGRDVFLRVGFHGASLDKVANVAGYTKGAVYSRFEDKDDLFLAVLEQSAEQRIAELETLMASGSDDLAATLIRSWEQMVRSEANWFLLVVEFRIHVARNPALAPRYRARHQQLIKAVAAAIARLEPSVPEPRALAEFVLALASGLAVMGGSHEKLDPTFVREALHTLLRGSAQ